MKQLYLLLSFLTFSVPTIFAQVNYTGNTNTGFGGPIGNATMSINDDGTTITATFTKGGGDFNDTMVMYIANGTTGRNVIDGNVNDTADANRRAISNTGSGDINFPSGFEATHAIAINTGFGGIWSIPNTGSIGSNGLTFVDAVGQPSSNTAASFTFTFDWSEIGLVNTDKFDFIIIYGNPNDGGSNMFSSDEAFGDGIGSGNPGFASMTFTDSKSYPNTWLGTDTDWSNAANWSEGAPSSTDNIYIANTANQPTSAVAITFNKAIVTPGAAIIVQSALSGDVILNSTSTSYSSLIVDGSITGTISYLRAVNSFTPTDMINNDNDLISAPVTGQTFGSFEGLAANSNLLASGSLRAFAPFNNDTGVYENYDASGDAGETLDAATGYRAATTDGGTLTFTGTVNTGTVSKNITVGTDATYAEWNLIGNPYPSYVDIKTFLEHEVDTGITNIDLMESASGIYGYDGDSTDGWDIITLANDDGRLLAPGQGFFVAADAADVASYDIEFTAAMRTPGSADDFITGRVDNSSADLTFLKLTASTANNSYKTEFYFDLNATQGLDSGYDAVIWGGVAPSFSLYSHLAQNNSGAPIALQALGNADISDITIPLGVNANAGEQLTFSISEMNIPNTIEVYLEDNVENTNTLLNSSDYVITPSTNLSGTGRFFLRFADSALSIVEDSLVDINIYTNHKNKTIVLEGQLDNLTEVFVYDILGRVVNRSVLSTSLTTQTIDTSALNSGIYVVKLQNKNQSKTTKVILS